MKFPPLRALETFIVLLYARLLGYKTQYIHYAFTALIASGIITRVSGGTTFYWNAGMPWQYKRPWLRERVEHLGFHLTHYLVTGAHALIEGYASYYHIDPKKIVVVPNWIDVSKTITTSDAVDRTTLRETLHISAHFPVLLFVHRLARRKGAHLLPEILAGLPQEVRMIVVGSGPEEETLRAEFERRGLRDRVIMTGSVPQTEVITYFAIADIFLLPSEEEGFPHVLTEAQAVGVPYVAFGVGGVREMSPECLSRFIVPPNDTLEFTKSVNILLSSLPSMSETYRMLLREHALRYDKEVVFKKFMAMISSHE
jgi:2-deoxystreptamine N-acetyl-D-glucosaminyltransferase/2-deoxystreptamine glucosyltransferase